MSTPTPQIVSDKPIPVDSTLTTAALTATGSSGASGSKGLLTAAAKTSPNSTESAARNLAVKSYWKQVNSMNSLITISILMLPDWSQQELGPVRVCVVLGPPNTTCEKAQWLFEFHIHALDKLTELSLKQDEELIAYKDRALLWYFNDIYPTYKDAVATKNIKLLSGYKDELKTLSVVLRSAKYTRKKTVIENGVKKEVEEAHTSPLVYIRSKPGESGTRSTGYFKLVKDEPYFLNLTFSAGSPVSQLFADSGWGPLVSLTYERPGTDNNFISNSRQFTQFQTCRSPRVEQHPDSSEEAAAAQARAKTSYYFSGNRGGDNRGGDSIYAHDLSLTLIRGERSYNAMVVAPQQQQLQQQLPMPALAMVGMTMFGRPTNQKVNIVVPPEKVGPRLSTQIKLVLPGTQIPNKELEDIYAAGEIRIKISIEVLQHNQWRPSNPQTRGYIEMESGTTYRISLNRILDQNKTNDIFGVLAQIDIDGKRKNAPLMMPGDETCIRDSSENPDGSSGGAYLFTGVEQKVAMELAGTPSKIGMIDVNYWRVKFPKKVEQAPEKVTALTAQNQQTQMKEMQQKLQTMQQEMEAMQQKMQAMQCGNIELQSQQKTGVEAELQRKKAEEASKATVAVPTQQIPMAITYLKNIQVSEVANASAATAAKDLTTDDLTTAETVSFR